MTQASSRESILQKLRTSGDDIPLQAKIVATVDEQIDRYFLQRDLPERQQMVDMMASALSVAQAKVIRCQSHQWPGLMADMIAAAGINSLLMNPDSPEGQLLNQVLPTKVRRFDYAQQIDAWKSELFDAVDAGFTVARSGIANTGTLIIVPDEKTPRTVSLVPPLHIALVYASTLHPDLYTAVKAERWQDGMPSNLVMVSGPSKTSDIQQTLAYGAHGPRWMWVFLIEDEINGDTQP
jgi:L-lactate dehydrogenase complex protein LldG